MYEFISRYYNWELLQFTFKKSCVILRTIINQKNHVRYLLVLFLISCSSVLLGQQVADENYNPPIAKPEYKKGEGALVFIDEGHHNFHTKEGRYKAFSNLLERDGYLVESYKGAFDKKKLQKGKILVISNALNKKNVRHWYVPIHSAFTPSEIETVRQWVEEGGNLFLIADHMPMAGAAKDLASAFEIEFTDGFVFDTITRGPSIFTLKDKTLIESSITKGRNSEEVVKKIASFTGQGFKVPENANPILIFNANYVNLLPDTAWVFTPKTKRIPMKGWSQGVYGNFGKGRIVVFGEAAMFTAQLAGPEKNKAGMNNPIAPENYKLLLNIIHWLDGKFE